MKRFNFFLLIILLLVTLTGVPGCVPADDADDQQPSGDEDIIEPEPVEIGEDGHPVGWGENTHGKNASPNYKLLFDHNDVLRFDLVIAPKDWQAMLDDMKQKFGRFGSFAGFGSATVPDIEEYWKWGGDENPVYVPCNLVFQGITWHHVGIRFKGSSSLKTTWQKGSYKLPLRLTFDKFEDDYPEIENQRFYGFKKMGLSNGVFDNSLIREKTTNEIFRSAGIPVGRDAFCQIYIDYGEGKKYFGLYTLQEIPAKPMLKTTFIEDDGNLYKPDGNGGSFSEWEPEDLDKETNEEDADFSDVKELYDVLQGNRENEVAFRQRLESLFNVDMFLHYLAINQVICNWDTYGNLPHNYYLYHDPGDDLLHWIPFDFNFALETVGLMSALSLELSPAEVSENWPLIRFLLDIDDYHARYVYYVKKTIDEIVYPERMQTILADTRELISPYVEQEAAPYSLLPSFDRFTSAIDALEKHIAKRHKIAQQFVKRHQQELNSDDGFNQIH